MEYLLGIDVGTSGTKTVLFDTTGKAVCSKTFEYPMYQPKNGWAEQKPSDWWNASRDGVKYVLSNAGVNSSDVKGVGISGQMHGLVMLDKDANVLRDSIIWCDQRTAKECEQMNEVVGARKMIEITANPPMTGFTASKILWVRNNEPEIYEKCAHILLPKDYIRYMLTGEFATEVSDAAGMQLMDIGKRAWSVEILSKLGIDSSLLAKMYESPDVTGVVNAKAASETGLKEGTVVVGGAGDNAAAAVGMGVVAPGAAFTTIGTSGVIYAVSDTLSIDMQGRVHSLCASAPGKWTVMSCTQGAGLSLQWFRNNFCFEEMREAEALGTDPYILMDRLAETVKPGAGGLIYLPYLMGERSPHPDPFCRGVFFGLSAIHTKADMIRAVMEGVAYSQWECMEVFGEMNVAPSEMTLCGGGGRSPLWRQMLCDMYNRPVSVVEADEGPALGVAILAGVGAGVFKDVYEGCGAIVRKNVVNTPNAENHKAYEKYFEIYKKVYKDLSESFKML